MTHSYHDPVKQAFSRIAFIKK